MISKSDKDRQFDEARMKFLHDREARLLGAREEGRAEGRAEGLAEVILVGKIQMLQQLLGEDEAGTSDLLERTSLERNRLFSELHERLRARGH